MLLKLLQKENTTRLTCGVEVTHKELSAKHQRLLTENGKKVSTRFAQLLADIIVDISGVDWEEKTEREKIAFCNEMLTSDRKYILNSARRLSKGNDPSYDYTYSWKDSDGITQKQDMKFHLIDESNRDEIIKSIQKRMGVHDLQEPTKEQLELIKLIDELNQVGGFPTKPCSRIYENYLDVIESKKVEFTINISGTDVKMSFFMLDGKIESNVKVDTASSHTAILCRNLRFFDTEKANEESKGKWVKVDQNLLDNFSTDLIADISDKIHEIEGDVDTIETFDNPDETSTNQKVQIDLMADMSFFFRGGKI